MKLYELTGQYLTLQEMVEDETVDSEVLRDTMEGLDGEIEEKADAYASIIFLLDGNIETLDKEIQRLEKKKKAMKNNQDFLKRNLEASMIAIGKKKFKTDKFSFGIQRNAPSLEIVDASKIPAEYFVKQEPKLDRKRLLADVKADTDKFSFGIQRNAPSLEIVDASKIPAEYFVKQEPKLDRKRLLADVKADPKKAAEYAGLKQTESLRIR